MKRSFAIALASFTIWSCGRPTEPTLSKAAPEPVVSSLFRVTKQAERIPTVVVANHSDAQLRLLLNRSDGSVTTLDVPPFSDRKVEVLTGHYDAKVLDMAGRVDSAYGTADIGEYLSYRAVFQVYHDQAEHKFHIGDKPVGAPLNAGSG